MILNYRFGAVALQNPTSVFIQLLPLGIVHLAPLSSVLPGCWKLVRSKTRWI